MILVTGGAGFIGAAWVKALVARGEDVRVLDNLSRGKVERLDDVWKDIGYYVGDIRNPTFVKDAMDGVSEVHHLAFINGTDNFYKMPWQVLDVATRGMLNIIDACDLFNVRNMLLVSSSEVYQTAPVIPTPEGVPLSIPNPHNPRYSYGAGKMINEMMALHCGVFDRLVIVRPHNIYGPDMGYGHIIPKLAKAIEADKKIVFHGEEGDGVKFYGGHQTRAFCYIDDAISGMMLARQRGIHREIYNVGTDDEIRIVDLAVKIAGLVGHKLVIEGTKDDDGGTERRCPDMRKLKSLGYEQRVSLDEGLTRTMKWYLP